MRKLLSSSAVALIALNVFGVGVDVVAAQGARQRGSAPVTGQAVPRSGASQPATPPGGAAPQPIGPGRINPAPPASAARQPGVSAHAVAVPRPAPRVAMPQGYRPNYYSNYRPTYYSNYRPNYQPYAHSYYRPYYTFLPHISLGFGLWVGYPVRYPAYLYPYASVPYASPYPFASPYPYANTTVYPSATYQTPGVAVETTGGLSFEISPPEASVYVDDQYAGGVDQFTPDQPPLTLAPGRHHVEIRFPGFETVAFDVDILPGQVIPYRGDLQRR